MSTCANLIMHTPVDANDKREELQNLKAVTDFDFTISIVTLYCFLHSLADVRNKLQGKSVDIALVYTKIIEIKCQMLNIRHDIDEQFHLFYLEAVRMASKFSVTQSMPRILSLQNHRNNISAYSPKNYFCRTVAISLLENYISELNSRFSNPYFIIILICLTPELLVTFEEVEDLRKVLVESYKEDLLNPEVLDLELFLWKNI